MFTLPSNNKKKVKLIKCSICDTVIIDNKDEAILCEGKCQAWLHRHCTGKSKQMFNLLAKSDEPFHCLYCILCDYKCEVEKLI